MLAGASTRSTCEPVMVRDILRAEHGHLNAVWPTAQHGQLRSPEDQSRDLERAVDQVW